MAELLAVARPTLSKLLNGRVGRSRSYIASFNVSSMNRGKLVITFTCVARMHVEQEAVGHTAIEQRQDVRMLQRRRGLDFHNEALAAEHSGAFGLVHLDRDLAIVLQVFGEINGGHTTGAEFTVEAVAVGEGSAGDS